MWIEKTPKIGDVVKVEWSEWYAEVAKQQSDIGIVKQFLGDIIVIDLGDKDCYLSSYSTIFVYEKY